MRYIITMLLGLLCTQVATAEQVSERIINGTKLSVKNSPIVQVRQTSNGKTISLCSGSLISDNKVLTAWHCVTKTAKNNYVRISNTNYSVQRVAIHPKARKSQTTGMLYNDVAVLTLRRKSKITPVAVATKSAPVAGDTIEIYGYGYDEFGNVGILEYGVTTIAATSTSHIESVFDWGSNKSNPCSGDSGGPAFETFTVDGNSTRAIVGIVSTGTSPNCFYGDRTDYIRIYSPVVAAFIEKNAPQAQFV